MKVQNSFISYVTDSSEQECLGLTRKLVEASEQPLFGSDQSETKKSERTPQEVTKMEAEGNQENLQFHVLREGVFF